MTEASTSETIQSAATDSDADAATAASITEEGRATPAEQEHLVSVLHEKLRSRFAGDGPDHAIIMDRVPSKALQLGILPALPQPDPGAAESPEQLAQLLRRPSSAMGLDFEIAAPVSGTIELKVEAEFSVYLQRYPTREEQFEFHHGGVEDETQDEVEQSAEKDAMRIRPKYRRHDIASGPRAALLEGERGELEIALDDVMTAALGNELRDAGTVHAFQARRNQTLPVTALEGDQAVFDKAIRDAEGDARKTSLEPPVATLLVTWQPAEHGHLRVQATVRNDTIEPPRTRQQPKDAPRAIPRELDLFNSRLRVYPIAGELQKMQFHRAPKDFRYADERWVWAIGRNAHGRRLAADECAREPLTTETWPVYMQRRMEPSQKPELQLGFAELADQVRVMGALGRIASAMKDFEAQWEQALDGWADEASRHECRRALDTFRGDMAAFERGLNCMRRDQQLKAAFCAANAVFNEISKGRKYKSWRLFQVVYQVIHLQSLRVRETPNDEALRAELDIADVLWFPTGGGKTEAYLGLIITALFYDRLRGKQRGVSAMLRFPLRMLSVQQLQRLLVAVAHAEAHRQRLLNDGVDVAGDPFALGYWAGRDNSPNSLVSTRAERPRENIDWWVNHVADAPDRGDSLRIVTICPQPGCGGKLRLKPHAEQVRLRHVCKACGKDAPVHITDDEVYRYLPGVIVSTVDKLAHIARAEQLVGLLAGPAFRCPDHGYFSWHQAVWLPGRNGGPPDMKDRCIAGHKCNRGAKEYTRVDSTKDPCPAILVQDELHLLEEELGTFSSHYETLLKVLQEELGDGLPSKVLAATATIESFEAQVNNLYAREARVFPSPGYELGETFYVETHRDVARRVYVGALPARPDVQEFGALAQGYLHEEVMSLQDDLPTALATLGWVGVHTPLWLAEQLLNYELTLGYVNRKQDADKIASVLKRLPRRRLLREDVESKVLIGGGSGGGTPLAEIADTLQRVIDQYDKAPRPERQKRLRAWIATSLISHGVDLDPLNLMIVNGMTPTIAGYVQASSRAGRTHVGLVLVGFNRRSARERSFFQFFSETHAFLDRMIAPVPVNRFARFAAATTVPGLISALVTQLYGHERLTDAGRPDKPTPSLQQVKQARMFLLGDKNKKEHLLGLLQRALGVGATVRRQVNGRYVRQPIFDPRMTQWLEQEAAEQLDRQWDNLVDTVKTGRTPSALSPEPLASFRQVDEPIDLNPFGKEAEIQAALTRTAK